MLIAIQIYSERKNRRRRRRQHSKSFELYGGIKQFNTSSNNENLLNFIFVCASKGIKMHHSV